MHSDGTSNILIAFDTTTGTERWRYTIGPIYKGHSGSSDGPTSTPTISGNAVYAIDETLDLSEVVPMIAKPFSPGNAHVAADVAEERIEFDKAYIGSCTNGSYDDLLQAALVIRAGREVGRSEAVRRFVIFPGSGGTTRLVRMLGLMGSSEFLLHGKTPAPKKAKAGGLIDDVVDPDDLTRHGAVSRQVAEQILPDGCHVERAPMYHAVCLKDLIEVQLLLGAASPVWLAT